jgi:hypothetical protein
MGILVALAVVAFYGFFLLLAVLDLRNGD